MSSELTEGCAEQHVFLIPEDEVSLSFSVYSWLGTLPLIIISNTRASHLTLLSLNPILMKLSFQLIVTRFLLPLALDLNLAVAASIPLLLCRPCHHNETESVLIIAGGSWELLRTSPSRGLLGCSVNGAALAFADSIPSWA